MTGISDDLAPRYARILRDDASDFAYSLEDAYKSSSIADRYKFRFEIYKDQAKVFEKLFNDSAAPLVHNPGEYIHFRHLVHNHIAIIENALKQRDYSRSETELIEKSDFEIREAYREIEDK